MVIIRELVGGGPKSLLYAQATPPNVLWRREDRNLLRRAQERWRQGPPPALLLWLMVSESSPAGSSHIDSCRLSTSWSTPHQAETE